MAKDRASFARIDREFSSSRQDGQHGVRATGMSQSKFAIPEESHPAKIIRCREPMAEFVRHQVKSMAPWFARGIYVALDVASVCRPLENVRDQRVRSLEFKVRSTTFATCRPRNDYEHGPLRTAIRSMSAAAIFTA